MIIHCLECGKSVSSKMNKCPFCITSICTKTLQVNGIREEAKPRVNRFRSLVFSFVNK